MRVSECSLGSDTEPSEGQGFCAGFFQDRTNGGLSVFGKWLIQQSNLFEVTGQAAFNDVLHGTLWLTFSTGGLFSDTTLIGDGVFWYLVTGEISWAHCSYVYSNIVGRSLSGFGVAINGE